MARRRNTGGARDYPRTARLNELLREIIASEVERTEMEGVGLVTITGVDVDNELTIANVYFSTFDDEALVQDELDALRKRVKSAIGRQARMRRVPEVVFQPDRGVQQGGRVEEILRELYPDGVDHSEEADGEEE